MTKLTHIGSDGRARMVDISEKAITCRTAIATGKVTMIKEAFDLTHMNPKGDPIGIAELAGIMGTKKTSDLIPLCHPLPLTKATVSIKPLLEETGFFVEATVKTNGKTGVEMEALTAVSVACLTLYDMFKAVDKSMVISDIKLDSKTGGKSGDYKR